MIRLATTHDAPMTKRQKQTAQRRALGLCIACGLTEPPINPKTGERRATCEVCSRKATDYNATHPRASAKKGVPV